MSETSSPNDSANDQNQAENQGGADTAHHAAKGQEPEPISVTHGVDPRAWPPKLIRDLMTRKIITLREDEAIGNLEGWMERFRFRHLPVIDSQMKLVGLITRTDYLHGMLDGQAGGKLEGQVNSDTHASVIMHRNIVTAKPDYELATALRVMLKEKLSCLPVVNEDGTLVGIVTDTDFSKLALAFLERTIT